MNELLDTLWLLHNAPGAGHDQQLGKNEPDFEAGQRLQLALLERWLDQGSHLGGWKIGMTSGANRNGMGDGIRPFGFVLAERIIPSGHTLPLAELHRGQVENELCFLLGKSLGGDADRAAAVNAVEAVLPAFEINQKRLPGGAGPGLRVADNLSNWGIVIGDPAQPRDDYAAQTVSLYDTTEDPSGLLVESVDAAGHIDDHYESLATLARTLHAYGHTLAAGQYVITGAFGKTPFAAGTWRGDFTCGVGSVEITLA